MVFLLAVTILIFLPVYVTVQMTEFAADDTEMTKIEFKTARTMDYPVITVCNSKIFDKRKMEGKETSVKMPVPDL